MADLGKALDWNDEIEKENNFVLLPEGDYDFTISHYEKGRFDGSEKMAASPKATVFFEIDHEGEKVTLHDDFILNSKMEWKLSQLFKAVGMKESGQKVAMNWNALAGSTGRLKVKLVPGTKNPDQIFNQIDKLYAKAEKGYVAGKF